MNENISLYGNDIAKFVVSNTSLFYRHMIIDNTPSQGGQVAPHLPQLIIKSTSKPTKSYQQCKA